MTERTFRILLGTTLVLFLYMEWQTGIVLFVGLMLFEGLTNLRITLLLSRLRGSSSCHLPVTHQMAAMEAERALRLVVAAIVAAPSYAFGDAVWFIPWFVAFMLVTAGITNICPMYFTLRGLGFR